MKFGIVVVAVCCIAAESFAIGRQDTTEETRARLRASASKLSQLGGLVERPGHGRLALVSAQKTYPADELASLAGLFGGQLHFKVEVADAGCAVTTGNAAKVLEDKGLSVGVFLVDDEKLPLTLVAAEERWAIVNAAKVAQGASDPKAKSLRLQRVLSRIFKSVFLNGAAEKGAKAVRTASDLDGIIKDTIDGQQLFTIVRSMPSYGLVAPRLLPYKLACQEGWAPPPTNQYQKAIWDKVHAIPDKPLKIEFDPKKDK